MWGIVCSFSLRRRKFWGKRRRTGMEEVFWSGITINYNDKERDNGRNSVGELAGADQRSED